MQNNNQTSFNFHEFDRQAGERYAQAGAQKAIDHAQLTDLTWSEQALKFLLGYIKTVDCFMVEDVRLASRETVPLPPSLRAWGSIIKKAAKLGWIYKVGYAKVKNVKAHAANANLWRQNPN